jgi:hypothetical protein
MVAHKKAKKWNMINNFSESGLPPVELRASKWLLYSYNKVI